jgi:hypothetical protein
MSSENIKHKLTETIPWMEAMLGDSLRTSVAHEFRELLDILNMRAFLQRSIIFATFEGMLKDSGTRGYRFDIPEQ